ncbi:MAG: sigma 54-interacting transcriptional regulator [bacterium]
MSKPTILIANWHKIPNQNFKRHLSNQGFEIIEALDKISIIRFFQYSKPNLIIINSSLENNLNEIEIIKHIRMQDKKVPIILITKYSSEDRIIDALRAGVNDYFKQPFLFRDLMESINRNLSISSYQPLAGLNLNASDSNEVHFIIGQSESVRNIKSYILKAATTDSTVLITGETGTGKELTAELIHTKSLNSDKPFVHINCASLPENLLESELFGYERGAFTGAMATKRGKLEMADQGTIFLDEIGDMNLCSQSKILSVIERKEVYRLGGGNKAIPLSARIIAATNRNPEQMVAEGKFREDLYYRLNIARIHIPPLRDRKEDIIPLIEYYIRKFNNQFGLEVEGLTEEALSLLIGYSWPGNIRELKNIIEATFINLPSQKISFVDLPEMFQKKLKGHNNQNKNEKEELLSALLATSWNKSKCAQMLKWSRMTLYRKMAKYRISSMPIKNNS